MAVKRKNVVLDDALIGNMYRNPAYTGTIAGFQPLASALKTAKKQGSCGPCTGRDNGLSATYNRIKEFFALLDDVQIQKLKDILNTEQLTIYDKASSGKLMQKVR